MKKFHSQRRKEEVKIYHWKKYPNQTTLSNGHTIIKLEDGSYGLFLSKSLASQSWKIKNKKVDSKYFLALLQCSKDHNRNHWTLFVQLILVSKRLFNMEIVTLAKKLEENKDKDEEFYFIKNLDFSIREKR